MREWRPKGYNGPFGPTRNRPIVSSIRLEDGSSHETIHIWNRGGNSGMLIVDKGDGMKFVKALQSVNPGPAWDDWEEVTNGQED